MSNDPLDELWLALEEQETETSKLNERQDALEKKLDALFVVLKGHLEHHIVKDVEENGI